jgi:hypothetical protein
VTDLLDQAFFNACFGLLTADPLLTALDGQVPTGTGPPYALVYFSLARPSDDPDNAMDGRSRVWVALFDVHCVGGTPKASRAVAQRVRTNWLDLRPVVPGLVTQPIRMDGEEPPPQKDETTGTVTAVWDTTVSYRCRATG